MTKLSLEKCSFMMYAAQPQMLGQTEYLKNLGEVTELAESTGLENRRWVTNRGFESHPLRHIITN